MVGVPSSCSVLSVLVGTLFKKFGLFLNTPCMCVRHKKEYIKMPLYLELDHSFTKPYFPRCITVMGIKIDKIMVTYIYIYIYKEVVSMVMMYKHFSLLFLHLTGADFGHSQLKEVFLYFARTEPS